MRPLVFAVIPNVIMRLNQSVRNVKISYFLRCTSVFKFLNSALTTGSLACLFLCVLVRFPSESFIISCWYHCTVFLEALCDCFTKVWFKADKITYTLFNPTLFPAKRTSCFNLKTSLCSDCLKMLSFKRQVKLPTKLIQLLFSNLVNLKLLRQPDH